MQLAEGNAVSESAISAMATVRAFGAETAELEEFEKCMDSYITLNYRVAAATFGYSTCVNVLPELVTALVLFYGGLLVQSQGPDHITGGQLVSFILYLSSLSNAFSSLGGIFASLTRAVGAADKVFELMHRKSKLTPPSLQNPELLEEMTKSTLLGVKASRTMEQRAHGLSPDSCEGEITLKNVDMRYPARPQHLVLKGLDLQIPAGAVVALVGTSGSGVSRDLHVSQLFVFCSIDCSRFSCLQEIEYRISHTASLRAGFRWSVYRRKRGMFAMNVPVFIVLDSYSL